MPEFLKNPGIFCHIQTIRIRYDCFIVYKRSAVIRKRLQRLKSDQNLLFRYSPFLFPKEKAFSSLFNTDYLI